MRLAKTGFSLILVLTVAIASWANPTDGALKGKVLETMNSGGYTYVKLSTQTGEQWAAVPEASVKKGAEVTIDNPMQMNGFESKTLKRKFEHIVFGSMGGGAAAGAPSAMSAMSMPTGGGDPHGANKSQGPVDLKSAKVSKAQGADAYTVADVYKHKDHLKDKTVVVHGKVVKVNVGIMNKNWVHVRDGSGTEKENNYDLIVTTKAVAQLGDVILVKGVVHLNQDLGSGYKYAILVEDSTLTK